jgi:ABC-2 type transport system ATP-binding protein
MTTNGSAIAAERLVKTYPKDVRALDDLSFTVARGTVFGLLGPNGAGKSTTIKILTTLTLPDGGIATVAGIDVLRRPNDVRRAIGVVTQRHGTDPQATGRENLVLSGRIYGMGKRDAQHRATELLDRFGLTEAADRIVRTYSGGMQRKLDVVLGLVHRPQVLFLDEPTTGLDPEARAQMWAEIRRLSRDEGITILLTTHYLDEADQLAEQLAIVDRGKLVIEGTPEQLKSELRGDAVVAELAPDTDAEKAQLVVAELPGIRDATVEGRTIRARVNDGAHSVPDVLAALDGVALPVTAITVAQPSLDDVYLKHTGRSFAAAETSEESK